MKLVAFENLTGEGVVSFQPCRTQGPEYDADHSRWYHHLLVSGQRVFEYGCPCGTCGILFRKLQSASERLDDGAAVELLGRLDAVPSRETLPALARILEPTTYHPVVLEGRVEFVEPGSDRDYFATDVVHLFGLEPPDYERPSGPDTPYYRFGVEATLKRSGRLGGPHRALATSVLMPLYDPAALSRERIEYWRAQHEDGMPMTALAVGVIDGQAPAMKPANVVYPFEEQFLLSNCLLDGHHRVQAAAEAGSTVRVLSFLALGEQSLVAEADVPDIVRGFVKSPDLA